MIELTKKTGKGGGSEKTGWTRRKAGIPRQQTASSELNRIQLDEAISEKWETESMKEEEEGRDGVGGAMAFFFSCPPSSPGPVQLLRGRWWSVRSRQTTDRKREIFFFFFSLCSSSFWLRGGGPVSNFFSSHWWTCASSTLVQLSTWPVVNAVGYIESRSPWSLTRPSVATISCDSLHRHHTTDGWRTSSKCVAITKVRGRRSNSSRLSSVFIKSISSATNGFDDKFAQPRATGRLLEWLEQSGFGPSSRG